MTKKSKKVAIAYKDASAQLIKKVEGVMAEAKKHTFSVSRIYAAHNEVFQINEKPQTCGSCLKTRAANLTKWYEEANKGKLKAVKTDGNKQFTADEVIANHQIEMGETPAEGAEALSTFIASGVGSESDNAVLGARLQELIDETEVDGQDALVLFTPAEEGAQFGIATKGGQPLPAGNYAHEGQQYAVNGEDGNYTVITGEPAGEEAQRIADGVTVLKLKDGQDVHFTTEDKSAAVLGSKGTVLNADGSNVKTGKHPLADGGNLSVAVGGRASIKE